MSDYGAQFDRIAETWRVVENEHDRQHPDRSQCGGVGVCAMMRAAHDLESGLMDALAAWRERNPSIR